LIAALAALDAVRLALFALNVPLCGCAAGWRRRAAATARGAAGHVARLAPPPALRLQVLAHDSDRHPGPGRHGPQVSHGACKIYHLHERGCTNVLSIQMISILAAPAGESASQAPRPLLPGCQCHREVRVRWHLLPHRGGRRSGVLHWHPGGPPGTGQPGPAVPGRRPGPAARPPQTPQPAAQRVLRSRYRFGQGMGLLCRRQRAGRRPVRHFLRSATSGELRPLLVSCAGTPGPGCQRQCGRGRGGRCTCRRGVGEYYGTP
jgi:hypothetical protein